MTKMCNSTNLEKQNNPYRNPVKSKKEQKQTNKQKSIG